MKMSGKEIHEFRKEDEIDKEKEKEWGKIERERERIK